MSMAVAATPFFHFESNNAANWSTIELDGKNTRLMCACACVCVCGSKQSQVSRLLLAMHLPLDRIRCMFAVRVQIAND